MHVIDGEIMLRQIMLILFRFHSAARDINNINICYRPTFYIIKYNSVKYVFAKGFMIKGMEGNSIETSDCGTKLDFHQI